MPFLTIIPCLNFGKSAEPEDDPADVDGDALENKFQLELQRESKSFKNWKRVFFRIQIARAFLGHSKHNQTANLEEDIKTI